MLVVSLFSPIPEGLAVGRKMWESVQEPTAFFIRGLHTHGSQQDGRHQEIIYIHGWNLCEHWISMVHGEPWICFALIYIICGSLRSFSCIVLPIFWSRWDHVQEIPLHHFIYKEKNWNIASIKNVTHFPIPEGLLVYRNRIDGSPRANYVRDRCGELTWLATRWSPSGNNIYTWMKFMRALNFNGAWRAMNMLRLDLYHLWLASLF